MSGTKNINVPEHVFEENFKTSREIIKNGEICQVQKIFVLKNNFLKNGVMIENMIGDYLSGVFDFDVKNPLICNQAIYNSNVINIIPKTRKKYDNNHWKKISQKYFYNIGKSGQKMYWYWGGEYLTVKEILSDINVFRYINSTFNYKLPCSRLGTLLREERITKEMVYKKQN